MLEFLKHVLSGQNQFASGGLLLMIVGPVGAYLRAIPSRIWYWVVGQTTLSITVKDEDAAFAWVKVVRGRSFSKHPPSISTRRCATRTWR